MNTFTTKICRLYVAYAPEFDVSAYGVCRDDALNNLADEIRDQRAAQVRRPKERKHVLRTHASLSRKAGIDPKVVADQLGHGLGVNLDVYTKSDMAQRAAAVAQLESEVINA